MAIYCSNAGSNKHFFDHERLTLVIPFFVGHIFHLPSIHSLPGQPMWPGYQYTSTMNLYEGPRMMETSSVAFFVSFRHAQSGLTAFSHFIGKMRLRNSKELLNSRRKNIYHHDCNHLLSLITTLISPYHQYGRYPVSK